MLNGDKLKFRKFHKQLFHFFKISEGENKVKANVSITLHKKWSYQLRISSVNVTKSAVSYGFGHIY